METHNSVLFCFLFSFTALTEPLYHGQLAKEYLQKTVNPILIRGLTELCKQKPEDPLVRLYYSILLCVLRSL